MFGNIICFLEDTVEGVKVMPRRTRYKNVHKKIYPNGFCLPKNHVTSKIHFSCIKADRYSMFELVPKRFCYVC